MNLAVNNINFQARLDISNVKTNRNRWENIAKNFRKETKNYPKDTMKVIEHEIDTSIIGPVVSETSNLGILEAITWNKTMKNLLENNDDKTIAKKITKLLDIAIVADSRKNKVVQKYERMADEQSWLPSDRFIEQRNAEFEKIETAASNKANRDGFLKSFSIIV